MSSCNFVIFIIILLFGYQDYDRKSSIVPISSLKYETSNSEFNYLKEDLKNAQIILIGENRHGDGSSTLVKLKWLSFLYNELGFDVCIDESPLQMGWYIQKQRNAGLSAQVSNCLAVKRYLYNSIWTNTFAIYKFLDEVNYGNQIIYDGFDMFGHSNFLLDLDTVFQEKYPTIYLSKNWINYKSIYLKAIEANTILNKRVTLIRLAKLTDELIKVLDKQICDINTQRIKLSLICTLNSIKGASKSTKGITEYFFKVREMQISKNLDWLIDTLYKNRKIVIFSSNLHILNNTNKIKELKGKAVPVGNHLFAKYGNKVRSIACIEYNGYTGLYKRDKEVPVKSLNSFEYKLHSLGYKYSIVDLKKMDDTLFELFPTINDKSITLNWKDHYNYLFYIDSMIPARLAEIKDYCKK